MTQWTPPREPAFDEPWLQEIAASLLTPSGSQAQLVDLYLERRLEATISRHGSAVASETWRHDGAASRWSLPGHTLMRSCNGLSPAALAGLVDVADRSPQLPRQRVESRHPLSTPDGWEDWAHSTLDRLGQTAAVRLISRRAAVIVDGSVQTIESPPLVSLRHVGTSRGSLLAVWQHPQLEQWIDELVAPPRPRPVTPETGTRTPVVFRNGTAASVLHEVVGHLLESDLVLEGSSPFAAATSAGVAPKSLSVSDDPTRWDLPGAFTTDDEGIPAVSIRLLHAGRLAALLCDRSGAAQLGQPPGRGRRASCAETPTPRMSNLVVASGDSDPNVIERDVGRGLVVTRCGSATVDPISGRLSVAVERGWELRRGRRRRPLVPIALTGTALELLASIAPTIGNDPTPQWRHGWCGKRGHVLPTGSEAPTLVIDALTCV